MKEMNQLISQLQNKYNNVIYWDFTYNEEFGEEDFFDACHLSDEGAKKFSKCIEMMLKN